MILKEKFAKQGNWLFRHRSYLPLLLLPFILIALAQKSVIPENDFRENIFEILCFLISSLGFFIRILTVGFVPGSTSGRNTKKQVASKLNKSGIYSIVRNPLYLGNFLMWLGVIMFVGSFWLTFSFILIFFLYYERIIYAEEDFLLEKFDDEYKKWTDKTPAFFPKFKSWKKPELTFSLKTVLRREYSSFFGMVTSFTVLEILGNLFEEKKFEIGRDWLVGFGISLLIYLTLRTLKKKTKFLNVNGR